MTLAFYGKSRKRQGGLAATALLAVFVATVGALWGITAAFAHHITLTVTQGTCENGHWTVTATTGTWNGYREAVITTQSGSPTAVLDFEPFVYRGPDRQIFSISGTGSHSGTIKQYQGNFGDGESVFGSNIAGNTLTKIATAWDADYVPGQVILVDDELMKITARSASGKVLTVERGFGATDPASHNDVFETVKRWIRQGQDDSESWNVDFNPEDCLGSITIRKVAANAGGQTFSFGVNPSGAQPSPNPFTLTDGGEKSWDSQSGDYTVTETEPNGWELLDITCTNHNEPAGNDVTIGSPLSQNPWVTIDLAAGDDIECTFTNRPEALPVTVKVYKVVCDGPGDFPATKNDILALDTDAEIAAFGGDSCDPASGWHFTYLNTGADLGPTDANGLVTLTLPGTSIPSPIRIAEVTQPEHIPFAGGDYPENSALISCQTDTGFKGDNEDWVSNAQAGGTYYCVAFNARKPMTITAEKVVCDSEADLPNWAGTGAVTPQRVADFVTASNGACGYDPNWVFEVHPTAGVDERPGDNIQDAPNFTNFTGSIQLPADGQHRIREQLPPGYVPFTGVGGSNVSAEFYCDDDVLNYDNLEWVGPEDAYCVGFNALARGRIWNVKIVTNVDNDATAFTAAIDQTDGANDYTSTAFSESGGPSFDYAVPGTYTATENPQAGYQHVITYPGLYEGGPQCEGQPGPGDFLTLTQTSAEQVLVGGGDIVFCHENVKLGYVEIRKFTWDGDSWEPYIAGDPFTFDITDSSGLAHDDVNAGTYAVVPGTVSILEKDPSASDYVEFNSFFIHGEACPTPDSPVDVEHDGIPGQAGTTVAPGETAVACVYNYPVGTVVLIKNETVQSAGAQAWDFNAPELGDPTLTTAANNTAPPAQTSDTETFLNVPAGTYSMSELQGAEQCVGGATSANYQTNALAAVGSIPNPDPVADLVGDGSINYTVAKGQTTYVVFENQGCGTVLSAANIIVRKFSTDDASMTTPADDSLLGGWTITLTGTGGAALGFGPVSQQTNGSGVATFLGVPDGTYTVSESVQGSWTVVGSNGNDGNGQVAGAIRTNVTVGLDQTRNIDFFNRPPATVIVIKTVDDQVGTRGVSGWQINLAGCGTSINKVTDGTGTAVFSNLLPADNCAYTVTETDTEGFTVSYPGGQVVAPGPGETATVSVHNSRVPTITTLETPTPTPTSTPVTPTATPTEPEETVTTEPEPTETVAGEKTPGPTETPEPGTKATPIAPETGTGFRGGGATGSIGLALLGLLAVSGGMLLLALGRRE